MKNKKKLNKKGFSLVEILVAIFIISLLFGFITYSTVKMLNNTKEKSLLVTVDNLLKTGTLYVKENINKTLWINDSNNNNNDYEFTCVSISALINNGYYKEKDILKNNITKDSYIYIKRDKNSKSINKEEYQSSEESICSNYFVKIPNNSICNENEYDATEKELVTIDQSSKYMLDESTNKKTNAGKYDVTLKLLDDYFWSDNTNTQKTVTCVIDKRPLYIDFDDFSLELYKFNANNKYTPQIDLIKEKIIEEGLVKDELYNHQITNMTFTKENNEINVKKEDLEIKDKDNNSVINNYDVFITNNINAITGIKIPNSSLCNNLTYNEKDQELITINDNGDYIVDESTNYGKNSGTYQVKINLIDPILDKWEDGSIEYKSIDCDINKANTSIKLNDISEYYTGNDINFDNGDVTVTDITNNKEVISPTITFTYYSDNKCTTSITKHSNVGIYYGKAMYQGDTNYEESVSNCAKLEIKEVPLTTYTVSYNSNGGTGTMANTIVNYGTSTPLRKNTFKKTGYTFNGWTATRKQKGSSTTEYYGSCDGQKTWAWYTSTSCDNWQAYVYKDQQNVSKTVEAGGTVTMKAQWRENICTITYNANGGKFNTTTDTKQTFKYTQSTSDMRNAKGGTYNATRSGYNIVSGQEWINGTYKYNQANGYKATDFCKNLANGDQSVTLKVNWIDNIKPTCSISKSNTYKTTGVTVTVKCSDAGTGCKTSKSKHTGVKKTTTYTVKDKAGNSGTCTATITKVHQTRHKTRNWNKCKTTKNTCKYGCSTCHGYKYNGNIDSGGKCKSKTWGTCGKGTQCTDCTYDCNCSSCKTGSKNECVGGWNSWGSWSSWSTSSCSESTAKKCDSRTVYK